MGFERTGDRQDFSEPGFNAVEMPGWSILIADGSDYFLELGEEHAAALSNGGRSLLFMCSDTVMCTHLIEYADAAEVWRISYEGVDGVSAAEITGSAPALVHEALAESQAEQNADPEADSIYDTTAKAGLAMTGFRHDSAVELPGDPQPVQVLRRT